MNGALTAVSLWIRSRPFQLLLALGLAAAALSCEELETTARVGVRIYDEAVICNENAGCLSLIQNQVPSEDHNVAAYISRQASSFGPGGLYLYFEVRRTSGAVALVEMDVPTSNQAGPSTRTATYVYREYKGNQKVFDADSVRGKIEAPSSSTCPCQDGRLELQFTDHGPDGVLGTPDDRVRRLSRGYFGLISSSCRYARLANIEQQKGRVEVAGIGHCPGKASSSNSSSSSSGRSGYYYDDDPYVGCAGYPEDDDYYYDDSEDTGCGGDDTYQDDEYSGCEGDSWDSGDSSSMEGCEADSTDFGDSGGCEGDSSDMGSGGCEGDSAGADMSCEGDAWAGAPSGSHNRRPRPPQWQQALGMAPPFLFLGLVHAFIKRRRRRQR